MFRNETTHVPNPAALGFILWVLKQKIRTLPSLTSLSLNLSDPCSPTHATQEHPGVQPHPQQSERPLGARHRPGSAVPGGLHLPDRSQTQHRDGE